MRGWPGLRRLRHVIDADVPSVLRRQAIEWYESGSMANILLQINSDPSYHAAIFAIRYRICPGWHAFSLSRSEKRQQSEAQRLESWLGRRWFESLDLRREYRRMHPECAGYSFKKLREVGPPYDYAASR